MVIQTFGHWREDPDLAGIREPKALVALPEAERDAWRVLWTGVDALLTRARNGPTLAGAINMHEENLKLSESNLGLDQPITSAIRNNLAGS
jgi:hypothetical protein